MSKKGYCKKHQWVCTNGHKGWTCMQTEPCQHCGRRDGDDSGSETKDPVQKQDLGGKGGAASKGGNAGSGSGSGVKA